MNLTTDAWIPALRADGTRALFSLQGLFADAHTLRDLAAKPHERIALMRLLLGITQAALDGPADEEEWQDCRDEIQPCVRSYLEKWFASFELFGDGPRFLQLPNLKPGKDTDEGNAATKLDLALATGNNSTLFDNGAGEDRTVAAARAALNLLTFQCFSPGGRIGVARWNSQDTPGRGSSNHAPCTPSSMLHTFVLGDSLLETFARNLLTKDLVASNIVKGWGRPPWELPVTSTSDVAAVDNATLTYLGRLVPYSRALRVNENGENIILGNGLEYPIYPAYREATATVVLRKDESGLLPASTGRGIWRQLHAITVKRRSDADNTAGPLAFTLNSFSRDSSLWIGAFVTDKAKIEDLLEATYTVPPTLFDTFGRSAYEAGVKHAEASESGVMKAIGAYASALKIDGPAYDRARQHFWTRIEQSLSDLFTVARELTPPEKLGESSWGRAVRAAAVEAYERSCPRRTPRQIQAYALGVRYLFTSAKSAKPNKAKKSAA
jgi:CRISPR system Cascade subunit CasA